MFTRSIAVLSLLLFTGCDEVVLFDVAPSGRLLVAADAEGACALAGGAGPRHLFSVDPTTGAVRRLTSAPRKLSWPAALGDGALFVEGTNRLMRLDDKGVVTHLYTAPKGLRLLQTLAAPSRGHAAVLEAKVLGQAGTLLVIDLGTGDVVHRVERALVGAVWTRRGLFVARALGPRRARYASGPGEVIRVDRRFRSHVLFRGHVPALTTMTALDTKGVIAALHTSGSKGPLALAKLSAAKRGARRGARGHFDFWPAADAAGKRLLFTRSSSKDRSVQGELRVARADRPDRSTVVPTVGLVAAPRWVGAERVAYVTSSNRLLIQNLNGKQRMDMTRALRAAYGPTQRP